MMYFLGLVLGRQAIGFPEHLFFFFFLVGDASYEAFTLLFLSEALPLWLHASLPCCLVFVAAKLMVRFNGSFSLYHPGYLSPLVESSPLPMGLLFF